MAVAGCDGLQCLSCGPGQFGGARGLPLQHHQALATHTVLARSEGTGEVAANDSSAKSVATQTPDHTPMARPTLRRQTPEVGARCGNTARRDLCGGHAVTCVPTAIDRTRNNGGAPRRKEWRLAHGAVGGRSVPYYGCSGPSERRMRLCFSVALRVPRSVSMVKIASLPLIVNPRTSQTMTKT